MTANLILKINNISKKFGKKEILKNLSYDFYSSEIYGIVGESGNGKTTLLNILGLIDNNYDGEIIFDNESIKKNKDYSFLRSNKVGFVFQSYYLIDSLSVKENILLPLKYSKKEFDENYFDEIVKNLNISDLINEKVNYLSGGEKQRVAIARALINRPRLIICDEPTGNLDENNATKVLEILTNLKSEDKSIIIVTHTMFVAKKCTKILNLEGGNLHEKNI